jgi:sensor domain CHASE-containing protein
MKRWMLAGSLLLLLGCGTIVVDDITVMEDDYHRSRAKVMQRAADDLSCSRDQLETRVLGTTVHADVKRMQVTGCDQEAVYTRGPDGDFAREAAPPSPTK